MSYSMSEIFTLSYQASRGAGLEWGIAEEAALACTQLIKNNLNGSKALTCILEKYNQKNIGEHQGHLSGHIWQAQKSLSPLFLGIKLIDRRKLITQKEEMVFKNLDCPIFLLPFLSVISIENKTRFLLHSNEGDQCVVDQDHFWTKGDVFKTQNYVISYHFKHDEDVIKPYTFATRADLGADEKQRLQHFASQIYAPETDYSRLNGAGAGLTDND